MKKLPLLLFAFGITGCANSSNNALTPELLAVGHQLFYNNSAVSDLPLYLKETSHKAFAQSKAGNWAWASDRVSETLAIEHALALCEADSNGWEDDFPCEIVDVNEKQISVYR